MRSLFTSTQIAGLALAFNFGSALCTIVANKYALRVFPYPAALTAIHYMLSWVAVQLALKLGMFQRGTVTAEQKGLFCSLVVAWATCNALSNASLEANSVGFYQLMKVLTTPIVVFIDYVWHGKVVSSGKAIVLAIACVGIGIATVSDVQVTLRGTLIAGASVMFGVAQKTLNEHMQQRGGLSTLQLMLEAFPPMTAIGIAIVPRAPLGCNLRSRGRCGGLRVVNCAHAWSLAGGTVPDRRARVVCVRGATAPLARCAGNPAHRRE